jgi:hypothetical protein
MVGLLAQNGIIQTRIRSCALPMHTKTVQAAAAVWFFFTRSIEKCAFAIDAALSQALRSVRLSVLWIDQ